MDDDTLIALLRDGQFRTLNLAWNSQLSPAAIAEAVSQCDSLTDVNFAGLQCKTAVAKMSSACTGLKRLYLWGCDLDDDATEQICLPELELLELALMNIGQPAACRAIQRHQQHLRTINVSWLASVDDDVLECIGQCCHLTDLDLSRTKVTNAGLASLAGSQATKLQKLVLSAPSQEVTEYGVGAVLESNRMLEELDLSEAVNVNATCLASAGAPG